MKPTLLYTKAGKGFKIVFNDTWYYTSKSELYLMLNGKRKAVTFRTIEDIQERKDGRQQAAQEA